MIRRSISRPEHAMRSGCGCAAVSGVTLTELIIVVTILSILATAAIPAVKFQVKRNKERELRADLWEMRGAIDAYKDVADWAASRPRRTRTTIRRTCRRWWMAWT